MIRIVLTATSSEYKVTQENDRVCVEKTHQMKVPGKPAPVVGTGKKFYGDAVDLQEGKPMVLRNRNTVVLTTSTVKCVVDEKGKGIVARK